MYQLAEFAGKITGATAATELRETIKQNQHRIEEGRKQIAEAEAKLDALQAAKKAKVGELKAKLDALQAAEVQAAEVQAAEVQAAEVRAAEVRAAEVRAAEVRANHWYSPIMAAINSLMNHFMEMIRFISSVFSSSSETSVTGNDKKAKFL